MHINKTAETCCGCTACENICPRGAITMLPDKLGFYYPYVDVSKCIDCGLCVKVCDFTPSYARKNKYSQPLVYAIRSLDKSELNRSQSGAAFFEFAKTFLQSGGIVYGAGLEPDFSVKHRRVDTINDLEKLRMSKYTQSNMTNVFREIRSDLLNKRKVLFSGTPCQVCGLNSYIGTQLGENLTTIDLVCHGVPSPSVWREYIKFIEKKNGPIRTCTFRDKSFGWASHYESFLLQNGHKIARRIFRDLFYSHIMLRQSCYNCPFTNLNRVADITIGDFWGWSKISNEFNDNLGLSLVLVNSDKGRSLLTNTKNIICRESSANDCLQPQLQHPAQRHPCREIFEAEFAAKGFEYVARKYGVIGLRYQINKILLNLKHIYFALVWHLKHKQ